MTLSDYMEMKLWNKRWKLLHRAWDVLGDGCQSHYPKTGFTLKEVADIESVIDTLGVIKRMYANI